ncbi:MAG: DNA-binding winged helix-turn-helix (wHTH) protein [Candidatus Azotimanducaceae bacterium]|jgi:DNA-binding winged helix-turn-helix (wHTH) protein
MSAFNDTEESSRCIKTLPKRGYKLVCDVPSQPINSDNPEIDKPDTNYVCTNDIWLWHSKRHH